MVEISGMLTKVLTGKIHKAEDFPIIALAYKEKKYKTFGIIGTHVFYDPNDHNNPSDCENEPIKTELMKKLTEVNHVR